MTDAGISALSHGCGQLQSIALLRFGLVTDVLNLVLRLTIRILLG